jgi:hypothetical protein
MVHSTRCLPTSGVIAITDLSSAASSMTPATPLSKAAPGPGAYDLSYPQLDEIYAVKIWPDGQPEP